MHIRINKQTNLVFKKEITKHSHSVERKTVYLKKKKQLCCLRGRQWPAGNTCWILGHVTWGDCSEPGTAKWPGMFSERRGGDSCGPEYRQLLRTSERHLGFLFPGKLQPCWVLSHYLKALPSAFWGSLYDLTDFMLAQKKFLHTDPSTQSWRHFQLSQVFGPSVLLSESKGQKPMMLLKKKIPASVKKPSKQRTIQLKRSQVKKTWSS